MAWCRRRRFYVPADDYSDPAITHALTLRWCCHVRWPHKASTPLSITSDRLLIELQWTFPGIVGERHYRAAKDVRRCQPL